jgi:uncharacterized RDD family membrane protein YckC
MAHCARELHVSDVSQGPGWWQASDGKWYRPEQHPNYQPPQPAQPYGAPAGTTYPPQSSTPAGWYQDPTNPGASRYWDGTGWSAGTQPPSYMGVSQYGTAAANLQGMGQLATWGPRVVGLLIDQAFIIVLAIIILIIGARSSALRLLLDLIVLVVSIYLSVQVGQTGQSPGMRVMGLKCIGSQTGQPIGGGMGVVRSFAHIVDSLICYIGWLFPLWDSKRQTLADKIMSTVVVRVPKLPFSITPPK